MLSWLKTLLEIWKIDREELQEIENGHMKKDCIIFQQRKANNAQGYRGQSSGQGSSNYCNYCKKKGHSWNNCCNRNKNRQNGNGAGPSSDFSNAFIGCQELNLMIDNLELNAREWCLDSGATDHMCHNESLFESLNRKVSRKVKIGDGTLMEVMGVGQIKLQAWNGEEWIQTTVNEVLYVPGLKINLFSVGKVLDKDMTMISDREKCEIVDKNGFVRTIATRQGKLFVMKFKFNPANLQVDSCNVAETIHSWHCRMAHLNFNSVKQVLCSNSISYVYR